MSTPTNELDARLLAILERRVPLVRRPFAQIAAELGIAEADAMARVEALRRAGVIREISGLFDASAMGYAQALVAMAVPPERLDAAGTEASRHPGVSHCYARAMRPASTAEPQAGLYNLWLTLAVSPLSTLGLQRTAELSARRCAAERLLVLPSLRRYKLQVRLTEAAASKRRPPNPKSVRADARRGEIRNSKLLSAEQIVAVRALQQDLPNAAEPFDALAADAGLDADMLLVHAADFLAAGWLRRYAAMLVHRAMGWPANVMVAWAVEPSLADAAGQAAAAFDAVSHCYLRPTAPDWPFGLYTMIHGRSEADCRETIARVAEAAGLGDRRELWTMCEYVKRRIRLFTGDEAQWESEA